MIILKRGFASKKSRFLTRLKGLVAKLVSLSVMAASALVMTVALGLPSSPVQATPLKLQPFTAAEVDRESLAHLLNTPLMNLAGEAIRISDYQDRVIVLNFWASWCPPCVEEMPDLAAIHQAHESVQVIAYGVDTEANIRHFVDKLALDLPIVIGEPTAIRLMRQLGNPSGGLPFTLIFAPGAELKYKIIGQVNAEELRSKLAEMTR